MEFIEACRKFIAIESTAASGNLELAQFAGELCRQAGLTVDLQFESLNGIDQANVIARPVANQVDGELMLQTHLDTYDPGPYGLWLKTGANPFNASIYQDTLHGLGAADVKLDFLCKLEAVKACRGRNWRVPPVLVGTYGEEQGMPGALKLIRKKMISAKSALVGEPTGLKIMSACKGIAVVEIEIPFSESEKEFHRRHDLSESSSTQSKIFSGKAAHSSMPQFGENAIKKMLDYLTLLPDGLAVMELEGGVSFNTVPANAVLEIDMVSGLKETIGQKIAKIMRVVSDVEKQFANYTDHEFTPPHPTLNIGMIRTYEEYVRISGCCRVPPTVETETYENWMGLLRGACETVGAIFRITDYKQPYRASESSNFIQICQAQLEKQGASSQRHALSASNEANVFNRFGIECVVIGPGQGVGNSHSPNEHVKISDLQSAIDFYKGVIERICL